LIARLRGPRHVFEFANASYNQPTRNSRGVVDGILVHAVDVTVQVISRQAAEAIAFQLEAAARPSRYVCRAQPDRVTRQLRKAQASESSAVPMRRRAHQAARG